jgi:hypothetical protein
MVHFIMEFRAEDLVFAGVSHQSADSILRLPMLEVAGGSIRLAALQHPMCDPGACVSSLAHLPADRSAAFLAPCPE